VPGHRVPPAGGSFIPPLDERKEGGSTDSAQYGAANNYDGQDDDVINAQGTAGECPGMADSPDLAEPNMAQVPAASLVSMVSGLDLLNELRGKYNLDPTFQAILQKPGDFRNFEVLDQLIYLKEAEKKVLCIPKVLIQGRSAREIVISEAHSLLAHLGASKTLDYL